MENVWFGANAAVVFIDMEPFCVAKNDRDDGRKTNKYYLGKAEGYADDYSMVQSLLRAAWLQFA